MTQTRRKTAPERDASRSSPRRLDAKAWIKRAKAFGHGKEELMALFADTDCVHMVVRRAGSKELEQLTVAVEDGRYPSVGAHHAPAIRLERAIRDLYGFEPEGLPDPRPWLDHGAWERAAPLSGRRRTPIKQKAYAFLPVEGEGLHQIPVGPVHAGIIEPGHFRFTANGETVVRLEQRLGYVHKGIEGLMAGAKLDRAATLIGRVSGDSTVAYAYAFARAVEAALGIEPPARAVYLRALMAELERIANHLGDFGAICNDASFALIHAHCGILREEVLAAADEAFGHRLMRDRIVPGGVAGDISKSGVARIHALVEGLTPRFRQLFALYDGTPSLLDRTVTTGIVVPELARRFAPGGFIGRASGRDFDARRDLAYAPYDLLSFKVPTYRAGDVDARVRVRIDEIEASLSLVRQILDVLPRGKLQAAITPAKEQRIGMALVEGFRGDVLVWVRLAADGTVARCHPRDPSWFQWPLLEAAVENNIVADFPLCNKSFNCSYSGHDL
ncbi:MAG: nickel-dependent hydrogenase large subunit [Xanthobacteraceae bacterium]|nr:nickel-dependent hydrogenase large subunit [Xanthobacteraceae bacterium]